MIVEDEDEQELLTKNVKLPTNLIISEGNKYLRLLQFEKAISSFQLILEQDSNNFKALLGRAKAYMRIGKYKNAWQDFQQVLKINPKCAEAVYLKGVTEYLRGDFEKGFFTYWEGCKLRPSCDQMRKGHQLCEKAIENNLLTDMPTHLSKEDCFKMSKLLRFRDITKEEKSESETYDKKGLFSKDLKLLEGISKDKNLASIHALSKDVFSYLKERQMFRKIQSSQINRKLRNSLTIVNNIRSPQVKNNLIYQLEICKSALKKGQMEICLSKGNELLKTLGNFESESFAEKTEMEASTLHFITLAYLVEGRLSSAMDSCKKQVSIARSNNMTDIEGRALRDMGEVYLKNCEYETAFNCFLQSLEFTSSEKEEAVLYYKISDCNTHLNDFENARNAAHKCLDFATNAQDSRFRFDALLLLAEIAVKIKDMEVAGQYYRDALEVAIHNHDPRQKDIENLLDIFEEATSKQSYSDERIQIVKLTHEIKHG